MLYVFDIDGTLVSSYLDNKNKDYDSWHILPNRKQKVHALLQEGHKIAFATNQAGVAFGFINESKAHSKIDKIIEQLEIDPDTKVYVCFAHPRARFARYRDKKELSRRKPSGQMILEAMKDAGETKDTTIFIGDMDTDQLAAQDAKVKYVDAEMFFA